MGYSDRVIQRLLPSTRTVVLFLLMVPLWYTIYEDNWLDKLDGPWGDVLLILFIAFNVGLCGVYGASVALKNSGPGTRWWFLLEVWLRTMLVGGLAAATAAVFT